MFWKLVKESKDTLEQTAKELSPALIDEEGDFQGEALDIEECYSVILIKGKKRTLKLDSWKDDGDFDFVKDKVIIFGKLGWENTIFKDILKYVQDHPDVDLDGLQGPVGYNLKTGTEQN